MKVFHASLEETYLYIRCGTHPYELLIQVYEAGLMLEEAQYLIDRENDWRKAVMAMKYISDKFPNSTQPITGQMLSVKYFDSIFYMEKVESLSP